MPRTKSLSPVEREAIREAVVVRVNGTIGRDQVLVGKDEVVAYYTELQQTGGPDSAASRIYATVNSFSGQPEPHVYRVGSHWATTKAEVANWRERGARSLIRDGRLGRTRDAAGRFR